MFSRIYDVQVVIICVNGLQNAMYIKHLHWFQIKKEGESIDLQWRLEEEMEEGECKVQWFFNDTELEDGDEYVLTFDGTYAKLFIGR